jgi:hypothetical protein
MGIGIGVWANLFLLLECACKLRHLFAHLLALRFLRRKPPAPFILDVLAHGTQRCAKVVLVALDDHLEFADAARLLHQQAILLSPARQGQFGLHKERRFKHKNLRCLRFELAPRGKELLLELPHLVSTWDGLVGWDSSPWFSPTVWLGSIRLVSCLMHALSVRVVMQSDRGVPTRQARMGACGWACRQARLPASSFLLPCARTRNGIDSGVDVRALRGEGEGVEGGVTGQKQSKGEKIGRDKVFEDVITGWGRHTAVRAARGGRPWMSAHESSGKGEVQLLAGRGG